MMLDRYSHDSLQWNEADWIANWFHNRYLIIYYVNGNKIAINQQNVSIKRNIKSPTVAELFP